MSSPVGSSKSVRSYICCTTVSVSVVIISASRFSAVNEVVRIIHQITDLLPATDGRSFFSDIRIRQLHVGYGEKCAALLIIEMERFMEIWKIDYDYVYNDRNYMKSYIFRHYVF